MRTKLINQFVPPTQPVGPGNQLPTSVPLPLLPTVEAAKRLAAFAAVDNHIDTDQKVRRVLEHWVDGRLSVLDLDQRYPTSSTVLLLKE
jgi:ribose 5-phosphate isomerase A